MKMIDISINPFADHAIGVIQRIEQSKTGRVIAGAFCVLGSIVMIAIIESIIITIAGFLIFVIGGARGWF